MVQRLSKQERRASRSEAILERLSVGQIRRTEKLVRRHEDGSVEVLPIAELQTADRKAAA